MSVPLIAGGFLFIGVELLYMHFRNLHICLMSGEIAGMDPEACGG
jgi:hypothetical protein